LQPVQYSLHSEIDVVVMTTPICCTSSCGETRASWTTLWSKGLWIKYVMLAMDG
ncbi:hypothetical protein GCK32_019198, partial [Trichostrongylus colubriformis]